MLGTRWMPDYTFDQNIQTIDVDCSHLLPEFRTLGTKAAPSDLDTIAVQAKLDAIVEASTGQPTVVYTEYVERIVPMLVDALTAAGLRVGLYTGEDKTGLDLFLTGQADVLIGSSAIATGVDGLQDVASRLVIASLPWTAAGFEQLVGRLYRQGQNATQVDVIVPLTVAETTEDRWSWCRTRWNRIQWKQSIADAAVDGVVPEGHLPSADRAARDVAAWLARTE